MTMAERDKNHVNEMCWKNTSGNKNYGQQEGNSFMNERARPAKRVWKSEVDDNVSWRKNQIQSNRNESHWIEAN